MDSGEGYGCECVEWVLVSCIFVSHWSFSLISERFEGSSLRTTLRIEGKDHNFL